MSLKKKQSTNGRVEASIGEKSLVGGLQILKHGTDGLPADLELDNERY